MLNLMFAMSVQVCAMIQLWKTLLNDTTMYAFYLAPTLRTLKLSSTATKDRPNARRRMKLKENRQRPARAKSLCLHFFFFFFFAWKKLKRNIYKRPSFFWKETCLPVSLQRLLSLESAERGIRGNMLPVLSKFTREDFRSLPPSTCQREYTGGEYLEVTKTSVGGKQFHTVSFSESCCRSLDRLREGKKKEKKKKNFHRIKDYYHIRDTGHNFFSSSCSSVIYIFLFQLVVTCRNNCY